MASQAPEDAPPSKRQKLSTSTSTSSTPPPSTSQPSQSSHPTRDVKMDDRPTEFQVAVTENGFNHEREAQVGIVHFVNETNQGFNGTLKQRYVITGCLLLPLHSFSILCTLILLQMLNCISLVWYHHDHMWYTFGCLTLSIGSEGTIHVCSPPQDSLRTQLKHDHADFRPDTPTSRSMRFCLMVLLRISLPIELPRTSLCQK